MEIVTMIQSNFADTFIKHQQFDTKKEKKRHASILVKTKFDMNIHIDALP
jgi:hypothetical protein